MEKRQSFASGFWLFGIALFFSFGCGKAAKHSSGEPGQVAREFLDHWSHRQYEPIKTLCYGPSLDKIFVEQAMLEASTAPFLTSIFDSTIHDEEARFLVHVVFPHAIGGLEENTLQIHLKSNPDWKIYNYHFLRGDE